MSATLAAAPRTWRRDVALIVLVAVAAMTPELAALEVDPFVVGNVRETYAPFIHNGETAVFVRAHTEDEVDVAVATIRLYAPIKIKVVATGEGAPLSHDIL